MAAWEPALLPACSSFLVAGHFEKLSIVSDVDVVANLAACDL